MKKNRWYLRLLALLVLCGALNVTITAAAEAGSSDDPLVTLSYLNETFMDSIMERVDLKDKLGVCLDTCHVYSAGYDIVNRLDSVLEHFDSVLGLERLRAIHLNDSMTPFSSFKDRHETIGKGSLGEQAFINIINHPVLRELPFFLETPRDDAGHGEEITWLKEHYRN